MESSFDRNAIPSSRRGYQLFEKAWDRKVAERHKERVTTLDDADITVIYRKSYVQLQEHYDNLQARKRHAALVQQHDPLRDAMEHTLART